MKAVVITTINAPTPAVEGFSKLDDFELITFLVIQDAG